MVFVQPSIADQLGPGLQSLLEGINNVINPNYKFQRAMQANIAANPELGQHLADLEANAPGTLQRLGLGKLGDIVKGIPESAAGQVARETRGTQVETGKQQVQLAGEKTALNLDQTQATIKAMQDPALRADFVTRLLSGENVNEQAATKSRAKEEEARANILQAQEPGVIAKAQIENKRYQHLVDNYPEIAKMNPIQITRDLMANRDPGDLQGYLSQGPEALEALNESRLIFEAQAARDQRLLIWAQIHATKDPMEAANIQAAKQMYTKSGGVGSVSAWYTQSTDPELVEKVKAKANSGGTLTPDEQDLIKVDAAAQQQQSMIDENENRKLQSDVLTAYSRLQTSAARKDNDAAIAGHVDQLNAALRAQEKVTGRKVTAVYGEEPDPGKPISSPHKGFFGGTTKGVFFVDPNGTRIDDLKVFSPDFSQPATKVPVQTPSTTSAKPTITMLSPRAKNFWDQYSKDPNATNRTIMLQTLKAKKPALYKEIEPLLNK